MSWFICYNVVKCYKKFSILQLNGKMQCSCGFFPAFEIWRGYPKKEVIDVMNESRLFKIVYYLLSKGHAAAPELAREFEVSVRTIYRDIDALSSAGIPVYAETGRNGGIYLLDNYVLDNALLSDQEKQELLSSLQSLSVLDHVYEKEMMTKLSALFQIQSDNWFEVDFSRWGRKTKDNARFEKLKDAVVNHETVSIVYAGSSGMRSKREINPLKLLYKAKEWYVKAYCTEKEDFRIFKLNRMIELEPTGRRFSPVPFPDCEDAQNFSYNKIVLRFPKNMAYRVYDEFDPGEIEVQEDGTLIAEAEMPEDDWLTGYLLSFGAQVEVVEPAYLREVISNEAKKIFEKNKP